MVHNLQIKQNILTLSEQDAKTLLIMIYMYSEEAKEAGTFFAILEAVEDILDAYHDLPKPLLN